MPDLLNIYMGVAVAITHVREGAESRGAFTTSSDALQVPRAARWTNEAIDGNAH